MENKIRILIADADHKIVRDMQNEVRKKEQMEIIARESDGNSAYEAIVTKEPDVVILDLVLPGLDGIGLLEKLQNNTKMSKKPCIIVTSSLTSQRSIDCSCRMGASYYMMKPCSAEVICNRILQVYEKEQKTEVKETVETREMEQRAKMAHPVVVHTENGMEQEVTNILLNLGIPAHVKGYQYLRESIIMAVQDMNLLHYITKFLYPTIAKKYNTTSSGVERAIRNAIGIAFTKSRTDVLYDIFGYTVNAQKGKVTNSEFIALIADRIALEYRLHA